MTSLGGKCLQATVKEGKEAKPKKRKESHRDEIMVSAGEIFMRSAGNEAPSYSNALSCLPADFYYTKHNSFALSSEFVEEIQLPGSVLPLYDASTQLPPFIRRAMHDNFRPPHGKAVPYLYSLGYGKEVGCQRECRKSV